MMLREAVAEQRPAYTASVRCARCGVFWHQSQGVRVPAQWLGYDQSVDRVWIDERCAMKLLVAKTAELMMQVHGHVEACKVAKSDAPSTRSEDATPPA